MCGITGIYSFTNSANAYFEHIKKSLEILKKHDSEAEQTYSDNTVCMGHTRLPIINTSSAEEKLCTDVSGRYTIVYNGEFYNYKEFYNELRADGVQFVSSTDTEVLLYLYIKYKQACFEKIDGCFAFAIYDSHEKTVCIARDRFGIKPLYFINHTSFFGFASELTALLPLPFNKSVDTAALQLYLQLHYIPAPYCILKNVQKLLPGHYMLISAKDVQLNQYYQIPHYSKENKIKISYTDAQVELKRLLQKSVHTRLVSNAPLGTFLSGGIDSSIISLLAAQHTPKLNTFSIGFSDHPFFDETQYAQLVAKHIQSNHTVISITNKAFEEHMYSVLDSFDEPFADSSAIAVSMLSKEVKLYATVALSGDGADELFAGYNKYRAHYMMLKYPYISKCMAIAHPFLKHIPQSRNSALTNTIRKFTRYANASGLTPQQAYIQWCSAQTAENVQSMLLHSIDNTNMLQPYLSHFSKNATMHDILYADQNLVLINDMLTKVECMSMHHGLKVRVPFLDHEIVAFANSLPTKFKINNKYQKRILQDAFRKELPQELYNRPKKGFEVPLYHWCTTALHDHINTLLSEEFIRKQNIFNSAVITQIRTKLHSQNPGDSAAHIWALLVFQTWWKKHIAHD